MIKSKLLSVGFKVFHDPTPASFRNLISHQAPSHNLPYHTCASLLMSFAWKFLPIFVFHMVNAPSYFNTWIHHHLYQEILPDCFLPSDTLSKVILSCISMGFIVDLGLSSNHIIWCFTTEFLVLGIGDSQWLLVEWIAEWLYVFLPYYTTIISLTSSTTYILMILHNLILW